MVDSSAWDDTASDYRDDAGKPPEEQMTPKQGFWRLLLALLTSWI